MKRVNKWTVVPTKRNKGLEPIPVRFGVIGHNTEIHEDDAVEFSYKLPLGAIKRLVKSYYKDIQMYDEENVYLATSSSSGMRGKPYCYRMINNLIEQLNKHGLNGKGIEDEIFDRYFKDDYEKMKRFEKNHGIDVTESFKRCNDPECCKPLTRQEKVVDLLRVLYFTPGKWIMELRWSIKKLSSLLERIYGHSTVE